MAKQIASNQWIYNTFGVGNNNLRMPTKSVIEGYGLQVSGSYASNQLVARDDISVGLISIPLYVIVRSTEYSWDYDMPVDYEGQPRFAAYFNLESYNGTIRFADNTTAPFYLHTSLNSAGDNQQLSMAFSYEQTYNVTSSFSNFYVYPNKRISSVYLPNIDFLIYDRDGWQINPSNPISDASYALSFAFKQNGSWNIPMTLWRSASGYNISSCILGDIGHTTLETGNSFYDYNLSSNNLQGFAIYIDRWASGGGGSEY